MTKPSLIIFTEGHPDVDTGFITPELNIILKDFKNIIVYPLRWRDGTNIGNLHPDIILKSDLADYVKTISSFDKKIRGLFSFLFWRSFLKIRLSKIKSLLNTCGFVAILVDWIGKIHAEPDNTIFYTYWLTAPTLALVRMKERGKIKYIISRAHGFDLYNERGDYILISFKPYIFSLINRVFCISEYGKKYLTDLYSEYSEKFTCSRMGTFNNMDSNAMLSDICEVISCSFLSSVKRVELLINGLKNFQDRFPLTKIYWTHIGGGPLFDSLLKLAQVKLNPDTFKFLGTLTYREIFELYSSKTFSLFINVSESEGLPVSIMEAQSFGIPVIATSVGGTPEIVSNENGFLLRENPTPQEIADAIYDTFIDSEKWIGKRIIARKNWEMNFNAEKNYNEFSAELLSVFAEPDHAELSENDVKLSS